MKKIFALLLASFMLLCACTAEDASSSVPEQSTASREESIGDNTSVTYSIPSDISDTTDASSDTSSDTSSDVSDDPEPEPNMDPIGFEYKTVYTDKLRKDGIYPYGYYHEDVAGIESYNVDDKGNPLYATDISVDGIPSYDEWIQKYTDEWFDDKMLLVCVVENEYGELPAVRLVEAGGGKITVHVSNYVHFEDRERDQTYHIFVEIDRADVDGMGEIHTVEVLEDCGSVYEIVGQHAKEFFEAYVTGDTAIAIKMMDSPDNPCLEWFSSSENCIGSMDKISHCEAEIIECGYNESTDLHWVSADVAFAIEGEDNIDYMVFTFVSESVFGGDWKISYFDFDA